MELTRQTLRVAVFQDLTLPEFEPTDLPSGSRHYERVFRDSEGKRFKFSAGLSTQSHKGHPPNTWEMFFMSLDTEWRFRPTKRGKNQFEIYRKLLSVIQDFITTNKPSKIVFSSGSEPLQKMYRTFLKKFFPGKWEEVGTGYFEITDPEAGVERTTASRRRVARCIQAIFESERIDEIDPGRLREKYPRHWTRDFTTSDGRKYNIYFNQEAPGIWNMAFGYKVAPGALSFGIVPGGKIGEVFRNVLAIIQQFIRDKSPEQLKLTAGEKSRIKLYRTMMRRLAPEGSIWDEAPSEAFPGEIEFTLALE